MTAPALSPARPSVGARVGGFRWFPELALALFLLVGGAIVAWKVNTRITYVILDETQIKASAVHYTSGLPNSLIHDYYARATSRLYPLLTTPFVANWSGDVAVRIVRTLNIAAFAGTAIPVYLIARQVIASRWRVVAAAGLSVALPWLVLTSALYTENIAYPLGIWAVWALMWVLREPSWKRDGLALLFMVLATLARTQLVALFPAYAVILLIVVLGPALQARRLAHVEFWRVARARLRRVPFSTAGVIVLLLLAAYELHRGALAFKVNHLLGGYAASTAERQSVPSDMGISALIELLALGVGLGVVPLVVGLAWYPRAWSRRALPAVRAYALASALAVGFVWITTLYAQGQYLDGATEERYYFYAAPFILIAAFAAWDRREIDRRRVVTVGLVLAAVAATTVLPRAFDVESTFFAPAISSTHYAVDQGINRVIKWLGTSGLSERDFLMLAILLLALGTAAACRWAPRRGIGVALGVGAVVQVGLLTLTLVATTGGLPNVGGRTGGAAFADLGLGDRASHLSPITWLDNEVRDSEDQANAVQRAALFWNTAVAQRAFVPSLNITPDTYPLNGLPNGTMNVDARSGLVSVIGVPHPVRYTLGTTDSPFFQIVGQKLRSGTVFRLDAIRAAEPMRLNWLATSLSPVGILNPGQLSKLNAWNAKSVVLHMAGAPDPAAGYAVKLGKFKRTFTAATDVAVPLPCGHVTGTLTPADKPIRVIGVTVTPRAPGSCPGTP